jgi:LmbE family N-acetylglucosaminyl deacetylase
MRSVITTSSIVGCLRAEVFAPLGIGHPDHELVARLVREACPLTVENDLVGITVYEELPYRVLHPEQVTAAFDRIRAEGWSVGDLPLPLGQGPRWMKEDAIAKYRSQFPNGADDPCLLVPERCWQIWKPVEEGTR